MRKTFALNTILLLFALMILGKEKSNNNNGELETLLKNFSQKQQSVNTIRARFTQENRYAMLNKPLIMSGKLLIRKPDHVLYTYDSPTKLFFLIKEGYLTIYYPDKKEVSLLDIKRHEKKVFKYLGLTQPIIELKKNFDFALSDSDKENIKILNLTPKKAKLKKKMDTLKLWINIQDLSVTRFEVHQEDGDITLFSFTHYEVNTTIDEKEFDVSISKDVKVMRGMMDLSEPFHSD